MEKYSFLKNSWLRRYIDSFKYEKGGVLIASIFARTIGVIFYSLIIAFVISIINGLICNDYIFDASEMLIGFMVFVAFDLYKFVVENDTQK